MPNYNPSEISYFARTNFRNERQIFGIKQRDRLFHFYCVGKSGAGKTTLLKTLMKEDLFSSRGFTFIDIHGDASSEMYQEILMRFPFLEVTYFDVTNPNIEFGYNPLRKVSDSKKSLVASNILEIFQRNWKSAWGMKMEHILRMTLLTLLDQPQADLSDILRLIHDNNYRHECQKHISNNEIKTFWSKEFPKYKSNDLLPIMNKVGALISHNIVKRILIENKKQLSIRKIMDENRVLIINLAKGAIGTDVSNLLGGLLLTSISSSAFSRIDTKEELRKPHFLYVDEFQALAGNELIGELLAQSRKFKLALIISNQFLHQLPIEVKNSILGNVGTIICFRLGITDAKLMEKEFYPKIKASDFTSLPNHSIYLRLMIDGKPSEPFSADTIL